RDLRAAARIPAGEPSQECSTRSSILESNVGWDRQFNLGARTWLTAHPKSRANGFGAPADRGKRALALRRGPNHLAVSQTIIANDDSQTPGGVLHFDFD